MALLMPSPQPLRLDLDLEFDEPASPSSSRPVGTPASPQRPLQGTSKMRLDLEEEDVDESLPRLSQAVPKPSFAVNNLDLADRPAPSRFLPLHGRTFDNKVVSFARKPTKRTILSLSEADEQSQTLSKLAMSMLEQPMHRMLDNIAAADADKATLDEEPEEMLPARVDKGKGKAIDRAETLWTDRYRPKGYADLLGDDRVHRAAMSWLKEWDQCVFKSSMSAAALAKKKAAAAKKRSWSEREENREGLARRLSDRWSMPLSFLQPEDPHGRPSEKVLLMCGPPGLGKTTLAHVLARQAGYQVLEINASDDRNAKVVHERIRSALESTALLANGTTADKPTCVIIDEIDGATGGGDSGFIKTLVRLVQDGSSLRKVKKGKKSPTPLLRPIICVCNDLYATALRPLRPLARIIRFAPPTNAMVVRRLTDICARESLAADAKSLTMLVEVVKGDLRSCLNTLQFMKGKNDTVDEATMRAAISSLKDSGTSPTTVWERLFKVYYNRKGAKSSTELNNIYVSRLARDVQTCGEYEKLAQGCFENYLSVKQPTDGWRSISKMHDWLSLYDALDKRMRTEHNFDLMAYTAYTFVAWYPLFASVGTKSFDWPKVDYENHLKRQAHKEVVDTLAKSLPNSLGSLFTNANAAVELAPMAVRILSPDLRPVNAQLVKADERLVLDKLVHVMSTIGFAFVHEKNEEGQLSYRLEPPIDIFVHYDGKRAADIPPSRYGLRSVVAKELEADALRKVEGEGISTTSARDYMAAYHLAAKGAGATEEGAAPVALDFFGRTLAATPAPALDGGVALPPPAKKLCVSYKHHEGFSNAVRLNIKINQLFRTS